MPQQHDMFYNFLLCLDVLILADGKFASQAPATLQSYCSNQGQVHNSCQLQLLTNYSIQSCATVAAKDFLRLVMKTRRIRQGRSSSFNETLLFPQWTTAANGWRSWTNVTIVLWCNRIMMVVKPSDIVALHRICGWSKNATPATKQG